MILTCALLLSLQAGERLSCEGVLGNSGEAQASLVRFGLKPARGIGVALDREGSLWDRGGAGVLNRYAPDGRLLASYRIPGSEDQSDKIAMADGFVILKLGGRLYPLAVDAAPGTEVRPAGEADAMSFGSHGGRVAVVRKKQLELFDPRSGERKALGEIPGASDVEIDAQGSVYVLKDGELRKYVDGGEVRDGWPKKSPGERPQLLGDAWFGHAWHGTVRRFTALLDPDPGVVLGGASGSFIGHLDQNSELSNGRGMARLGPGLYAVSGIGGVLHLLEWDATKRQMTIVRRIGALPSVRGLGLDRTGRVWCRGGVWRWEDGPDAPLERGVNIPEEMGQAVLLPGDAMVAPAFMWGKPSFYHGSLSKELKTHRVEKGCALTKGAVGSASYLVKNRRVLLVVDASGKGTAFQIGEDGGYQADAGVVELRTATPAAEWTSLAMKDEQTLLAAADGAVIELSRDGEGWKEARRWSSWGAGPADKFGRRISIAADAGRLWVSDEERHRVVCFDLGTGKVSAMFGTADRAGADLASLDRPGVLAARDRRAVVFDSANQRLLKLTLR